MVAASDDDKIFASATYEQLFIVQEAQVTSGEILLCAAARAR